MLKFKKPQWRYDEEPDGSGDRFATWDSPLGVFKVFWSRVRQQFHLMRPNWMAGRGRFSFDTLEQAIAEAEALAELVFEQLGEPIPSSRGSLSEACIAWARQHDMGEPVG